MPLKECSKVRKDISLPSSHLPFPSPAWNSVDAPVTHANEPPHGNTCTVFKTVASISREQFHVLRLPQHKNECAVFSTKLSGKKALTYSANSELCFSHQKYVIAAEHVGIQRAQQASLTLATKFQDLTQQGKITCGVIMWSSPSQRLTAS